ncbi:uncharacterized protein SCHCODRAFT_02498389 [Schizophyllum commune H4-8]|nr:uncharacterized protein SCHCODRAFT_02498389 [Schizophyllum commune H4-8]KAI5893006.1 hypothetical protein SCHCODRAFT_02498389 [Schizophyllum commune H4-8]
MADDSVGFDNAAPIADDDDLSHSPLTILIDVRPALQSRPRSVMPPRPELRHASVPPPPCLPRASRQGRAGASRQRGCVSPPLLSPSIRLLLCPPFRFLLCPPPRWLLSPLTRSLLRPLERADRVPLSQRAHLTGLRPSSPNFDSLISSPHH